MGGKAIAYFAKANTMGGLRAKIRLATLSRVTSAEAELLDDSPEVLGRLEAAFKTVSTEIMAAASTRSEGLVAGRTGAATENVLRRHLSVFLELMTQRSLFLGDVATTYRRMTEAAAAAIDVARVSVWLVDPGVTKIVCADLFVRQPPAHSSGLELKAQDFPPYFAALKEERTIAAHDAHTDPRTSCFSKGYLTPLGINSMLDVPIWVNQKMVGVVCHEHTGPRRTWTSDEEQFAYLIANFAALAMDRAGK